MKKISLAFLGTVSALGWAAAADAAVTVVGGSLARSCYEAADSTSSLPRPAIAGCDAALATEALDKNDRVATLVNRGILKLRAGDRSGAVADFDGAIAADPDQPEAYLNKGVALMQAGGSGEAISLLTVAIEKRTRRPAVAYLARGIVHEDLGNIQSAYRDYRKASSSDPDWRAPKQELARFQVRPR